MYLATVTSHEIRATLDLALAMSNQLNDEEIDFRPLLIEAGFTRSPQASEAALGRLAQRVDALRPLLDRLPDTDFEVVDAIALINEELSEIRISPSVAEHDGVSPHLHWTPATAKFDDQVMADLLMGLAQELCDNGLDRFGRCAADDCARLFYDSTRNNSRRFCADPRCASRTHTADHRARRRAAES